ncbi:MAG TPA: hypothetical protein VG406_10545 [Isosphaeraceae bacterium]|jgi:hypothetical protein|nr:hypothetical protein [Isosphaeraceae bacterium]
MADYPPPLDALLEIGDVWRSEGHGPVDYRALGVGREHVADLLRMTTDEDLATRDLRDGPAGWAPYHALHALGALRAEEAIGPLAGLFRRFEETDDDYGMEMLADVFGAIGPAALPALEALFDDATRREHSYALNVASEAIAAIGRGDPTARSEAVATLTRLLDAAERNDPTLNGFLVSALVDLDAAEAGPTLERAFDAGLVDETIAGDKAMILFDLDLGPPPDPGIPRFRTWPVAPTDPVVRPDPPRREDRSKRPDPAKLARQHKDARKKKGKRR